MTIQELLRTGRRSLFIAVNPSNGVLIAMCPYSFLPETPNHEKDRMLLKYPDAMSWKVVEPFEYLGRTFNTFTKLEDDQWMNEAGEIRSGQALDELSQNAFVRLTPNNPT